MLGKRSRTCTPTIRWKSAHSSTPVASSPLHHDGRWLGEDHETAKSCNLLRSWHLTSRSLPPANSDDQLLEIMPERRACPLQTAGPRKFTTNEASSREFAPWVDMDDLALRGWL